MQGCMESCFSKLQCTKLSSFLLQKVVFCFFLHLARRETNNGQIPVRKWVLPMVLRSPKKHLMSSYCRYDCCLVTLDLVLLVTVVIFFSSHCRYCFLSIPVFLLLATVVFLDYCHCHVFAFWPLSFSLLSDGLYV